MSDRDLQILVKATIADPERLDKYLKVIPTLSTIDRYAYALMLWEILVKKAQAQFVREVDDRLMTGEELDKVDIKSVDTQIINRYISSMVEDVEGSELTQLQKKLAAM